MWTHTMTTTPFVINNTLQRCHLPVSTTPSKHQPIADALLRDDTFAFVNLSIYLFMQQVHDYHRLCCSWKGKWPKAVCDLNKKHTTGKWLLVAARFIQQHWHHDCDRNCCRNVALGPLPFCWLLCNDRSHNAKTLCEEALPCQNPVQIGAWELIPSSVSCFTGLELGLVCPCCAHPTEPACTRLKSPSFDQFISLQALGR